MASRSTLRAQRCQQHFLDLCDLLGQPKPAAADPEGTWYTFERGVRKTLIDADDSEAEDFCRAQEPSTTGGRGWADVWLRDHFGWEYKGKHKDLVAAYNNSSNTAKTSKTRPS